MSRIYASASKLLDGKMASDDIVKDSPMLAFPSLTICPDKDATDIRPTDMNLTEDYEAVLNNFQPEKARRIIRNV